MQDNIYLKKVKLGQYRFPSYFNNEMKKYGKKLIEELVKADMLAVTDLDLVYDYITNVFLLNKVNSDILKVTNPSDFKRLQASRNSISEAMRKESNMLGLNVKARSSSCKAVKERITYDEDYEVDSENWEEGWTFEDEE